MPNQGEILQAIAKILGLTAQDIDRESLLKDDLNLGPIEINDLVAQLSERFDLSLDPEDISNVKTVDDLIILIEDDLI